MKRLLIAVSMSLACLCGQRPVPVDDLPSRPPAGCTPVLPTGSASLLLGGGAAWPGGVVPYRHAANVTPAMQAALAAAMQEISSRVRVQFVAWTGQADHVVVRDSTLNSSPIGRIGGPQFLDIANWTQRFEIVHALLHVLGFWHEHQRPDRDQFVQVQWANVDPQQAVAFQLVPLGNTFGQAYDFDSVTHFGAAEGGIGGATTIVVLPPNQAQQAAIGQRTHLSSGDLEALRRTYGSLQPPAITAVTPGSAPSFRPPQLTITGTNLDEVTVVRLDTVAMAFTVVSSTQLLATLPPLPVIGTRQLRVESGAGVSAPFAFVVTGNDPPVVFGPPAVSRSIPITFHIYSDATRRNVLLASADSQPSILPGVIALGIGNGFTNLFEVVSGVAGPNGDLVLNLTAPTLPPGLRMHLQCFAYDPAAPQLPLFVSNVLSVTIF